MAYTALAIPSGAGGGSVVGLPLVECCGAVAATVWGGMCLLGGRNVRPACKDPPPAFCEEKLGALKGGVPVRLSVHLGFTRAGSSAAITKPGRFIEATCDSNSYQTYCITHRGGTQASVFFFFFFFYGF